MADEKAKVVVGVVVFIVAGVIALICLSYADLHYYEVGFTKSKTTGTVDTSKVWTSGRRWVGPDKTFKVFNSAAHYISLNDISIFAAADKKDNEPEIPGQSGSEGAALAITVSVHVVYFLVPEDLKLLHDEYDVNYAPLIKSSAQSAIKDTANMFTLQQFYQEREVVEKAFLVGVRQRVGGMCCPINCDAQGSCFSGCIPRDQCRDADKGLFVDARYLQMTDVKIPSEVEQRNLRTLITIEETAKEQSRQLAAVIEKETEQLVAEIRNNALEVTANSTAQSQLITANSQANYQKILEGARRQGLVVLFNSIGLSNAGHKNSFDYLRSLGGNANAHLTVDFDQLIMGPTTLP